MGGRKRARLLLVAPALFLAAAVGGVALVRHAPPSFGWVLAALLVLPAGWVLVSALWPARAERGCPRCGKDALERLDPNATHGLCCRACGYRDESASAWLLAEEEGPLEPLVFAQRSRPRRRAGAWTAPRDRASVPRDPR
jgi:hypothetical protein